MYAGIFSDFAVWLWGKLSPLVEPLTKVVKALIATVSFAGAFLLVIIDTMDVGAAFQSLADSINSASALLQGLPVTEVIGQLNRVFPLNEFLVFTSILLGIKGIIIGLRIVFWLIDLVTKLIMSVVGVLGKIPL